MIFHKHKSTSKKYIVEYRHRLKNGKITTCPYEGCTKKYTSFICSCGKEICRSEEWI